MNAVAVVMAAGLGTRMKSQVPKVLFKVAGRALVYFPVRAAIDAGASAVVVVANPLSRAELELELGREFAATARAVLSYVVQDPPRGTGDAVKVALAGSTENSAELVLIISGDTPLVTADDLQPLFTALRQHETAKLAFLTFEVAEPSGYGRVLKDAAGRVVEIKEHRDLSTEEERAEREVNAGFYLVEREFLRQALTTLEPNNAQGEYYLTDMVKLAAAAGGALAIRRPAQNLVGINDRAQLAQAEALLYERIADRHRKNGVSVQAGSAIDDRVVLAADVSLASGVVLRGNTRIARGARIDVGSVIENSEIGEDTEILPYSVIEESVVGARAHIGPFAHLRPESRIDDEVKIGNFVETKKAHFHKGAKANHLSYLGDAEIGAGSNIGAGTITCNYDGFNKSKTIIGKQVFIGSDSQLVAPVTVGDNAYIATATTVTEDVPAEALAIGRTRQSNKPGYAKQLREKMAAKKKQQAGR